MNLHGILCGTLVLVITTGVTYLLSCMSLWVVGVMAEFDVVYPSYICTAHLRVHSGTLVLICDRFWTFVEKGSCIAGGYCSDGQWVGHLYVRIQVVTSLEEWLGA